MKRIISLLIVAIMLLSMVPANLITASAASNLRATIVVENVGTTRDSYVDVPIKITENPGVVSVGLTLSFDEDLTLVEASNGEAFAELNMTPPAQLKKQGSVTGSCRFAWLGNDDCTEVGIILNLKFKVSADADLNKECNVDISCDAGDVLNSNREIVDVVSDNGKITIIDYIPGDVDADGNISMLDVLTLSQYYVDGCKYDPKGYAVDILPESGDVDASGKINMLDILMICQYYVDGCKYDPNGYGVTLLPGKRPCNHAMEPTAKVDATCTEDGNIAYWYCTECKKYYKDEAGNTEVTLEDTVVKAGHDLEHFDAKAATTNEQGCVEHWKCSVCGKYFANSSASDELSLDEVFIPMIEKTKSTVVYNVYGSDSYLQSVGVDNSMNPTTFNSEDGLVLNELVSPDGYVFKGWSTADGTYITTIESHSISRQIVLNANWSKVEYKITFDSPDVPWENTTYTVDTGATLSNPSWFGYTFVGWSVDGNIINSIEPGTTGNITVHANWTSNRNRAKAVNSLGKPSVIENMDDGQYLFLYEIGTIENVPLSVIEYIGNSQGITINKEYEYSKNVQEGFSDTIAKVVSNATTKTSAWTLSEEWNKSTSATNEHDEEIGKTEGKTDSEGNVVGSMYYVSNSKGGSTSSSSSAGGGSSSSSKVTTGISAGINGSYANETAKGKSTELHVDASLNAQIGTKNNNISGGITAGGSTESSRQDKVSTEISNSRDYNVGTESSQNSESYWDSSKTSASNWNTSDSYENSSSSRFPNSR